jgi:hypothetical protein
MHWFDQRAFRELTRVTHERGRVFVYSDFFLGEVTDEPRFGVWMRDRYLPRLPTPPRRSHYDADAMSSVGYQLASQEQRTYQVPMTPTRLAAYLMTQSNVTIATQNGDLTQDALQGWVDSELTALLGEQPADVEFGYRLWVADKTAA